MIIFFFLLILGICLKDYHFLMFLNYYNLEFYFYKQIKNSPNILYVLLNQTCYELLYVSKFELDCNILCKKCKIREIYRTYFKIIAKKCNNNFIFFVILYDVTKGIKEFLNHHQFKTIYFTQNNIVFKKKLRKSNHILKYLKQSQFYK